MGMRKKRRIYKKVLEKLPVKSNKRRAKVMYKFVTRNKAKAPVNGKYYQHSSGLLKI